jgi:hypothetical protein
VIVWFHVGPLMSRHSVIGPKWTPSYPPIPVRQSAIFWPVAVLSDNPVHDGFPDYLIIGRENGNEDELAFRSYADEPDSRITLVL